MTHTETIRATSAADILAWREERAAIREFDGGEDRDTAEERATGETIRRFACAAGMKEAMREINRN